MILILGIAMRKTRTQQILKILNEHREKCIIAAQAVSSNDAKDGEGFGSGRNNSGSSGLIRTASLYPGLERTDLEEGLQLHKRVILIFTLIIMPSLTVLL